MTKIEKQIRSLFIQLPFTRKVKLFATLTQIFADEVQKAESQFVGVSLKESKLDELAGTWTKEDLEEFEENTKSFRESDQEGEK